MMMMDFSGFFTKDGTKCLFFFLEGEGGGGCLVLLSRLFRELPDLDYLDNLPGDRGSK